ncbi:MAG: hypothetical protein DRP57_07090 [Spirochaetes bacterium]|nr:MAG: hypothetical protein DRP57_07090 [Spirochaetota bacterium]
MKNLKYLYSIVFVLTIVLLGGSLTSCGVHEEIYLKKDGSGSVSSKIEVKQILVDYFANLAEVTGDSTDISDGKLFNTKEIKTEIEKQPGVKVTSIKTSGKNLLTTKLEFRNIEDIFNSEKNLTAAGIISLTNSGESKIFRFHLDKKNYKQLSVLIPVLSNPIMESLGPQEDDSTSEADYLDMMSFALGKDGPKAVKNSFVNVVVHVEGKIISQKGGKISGNVVTFTIPLIKILLLNKPLDYTITFK